MPASSPRSRTLLIAALVFSIHGGAYAAGTTPYPDALAAAAVSEHDISDISRRGLVVGNGEMNAILYSQDNDLILRIAKNDCWDMRVDTKNDPPMPTVNPATGKFTGPGGSSSWNFPYPTALPCAEVRLAAKDPHGVSDATLDLAKAVATVRSSGETTTVRVLAQSNVILITSDRPVSFLGITDFFKEHDITKWVGKADIGTDEDYQTLHQKIPGDADVSGMDIYVVAGKNGSNQAIAVVTSRDTPDPLTWAKALVAATLADAAVDQHGIAQHEAIWQDFWAKSGIQLGDPELQNWWYRMAYFYRIFSKSGGNAIGLAACFDHLAGWHNSLKLNYNTQQTYLAAGPLNHPELLEPFIDALTRNLNRGKWFAATNFNGAEGAFFHSDLWPFEPDPANCTTKNKHQQTYLPWGYSWGMDGHSEVVLWDYYKYAPTPEHLDRVYPLIRELGLFYCSVLEKCALVDGKRRIGPSFFPEIGDFGEFNVCYDITFITAGLKIARDAATLKGDIEFVDRLNAVLAQIPSYGTIPDPQQNGRTVIEPWSGSGVQGPDRHGTMVQGIFPAGEINWFSSDEMKELGKRTITYVENSTTHANSNVTINISRARLGLGNDAIANAKVCFSKNGKYSQEQPNGLFYWNAHGYYITEQVAIARLVTELLLQSVGDVIRIFPAWPPATDAHFTHLMAQDGFEVSADLVGGTISNVTIHSTVGGTMKLVSPWTNSKFTVREEGGTVDLPLVVDGQICSFPTTSGKTYALTSLP